MVELLAESQQLEEELRQILDYTQESSLARFRMNKKRNTGCDLDVCMMIKHAHPETHKTNTISCFSSGAISFLLSRLSRFSRVRRLSSSVWRGCRLMSSYARLPRVTDRLTGREGKGEGATVRMPAPPHPPYMSLAPTTVVDAAVEATATALDMVGGIAARYCVPVGISSNSKHFFKSLASALTVHLIADSSRHEL